jgi:hypothetical protein
MISKELLSAKNTGGGITLDTNSTGTLIHKVSASPIKEEVWLWAVNEGTVARTIIVQFGTVNAADSFPIEIPPKDGLITVLPGIPLTNALEVRAYCPASGTDVKVFGYAHKIGA